MVINKFHWWILVVLLITSNNTFCQTLFQGESIGFDSGNSGRLFFMSSSNFYQKAILLDNDGPMHINNKIIIGSSFGLGYDIVLHNKTTISLHFSTRKEPLYKFSFVIPKEEISDTYENDIEHGCKAFAPMNSFTSSLFWNLQIIKKNTFLVSLSTGIAIKYFPSGPATYSFSVSDESTGLTSEYIVVLLRSNENDIHPSILIGSDISIPLKKITASIGILYNYNLQSSISGEYHMGNFQYALPSSGKMSMSGNFIGISVKIRKLYSLNNL